MKLIYRNVYGETSKNVKDLLSNNIEDIKKDNNHIELWSTILDFFNKILEIINLLGS